MHMHERNSSCWLGCRFFKLTLRQVLHRFKAVKGKNSAPISVSVTSKFVESLKQKGATVSSKTVEMLMQGDSVGGNAFAQCV